MMITDLCDYTKLQVFYTTPKKEEEDCGHDDWLDFSFTQYEEEKKDKRMISKIEEVDNGKCQKDKSKKKKKRVPPPNPPYKTRKRRRCSMLRVSAFKKLLQFFLSLPYYYVIV